MPQYDHALRRRGRRTGREQGCWVYIPAEELANVGRYDPDTPPLYRVWAGRSGSVVVTLYNDTPHPQNGHRQEVARADS